MYDGGVMDEVREENRKWADYLLLSKLFSEEQLQVIDRITPMTQSIFDSMMQVCMENGEILEQFMFDLMKEYPEYLAVYAAAIYEEV